MNRLISILITLFVIFLIYIWINSVMSRKKSEPVSSAAAQTERAEAGSDETGDQPMKLSNYEEKKGAAGQDAEVPSGESPPPVKVPVNQKPRAEEPPAQQVRQKPAPPKKVANAANMHLVIAGNFMKRENAETRLNELLNNGYPDSEIVNFDLSEYYTVIAGRYDDVIEARRIAKKVHDYMSIDAYVRVGKN